MALSLNKQHKIQLMVDACDYLNHARTGGQYSSLRRHGQGLKLMARPNGSYAFNVGGAEGLQFNIGFEEPSRACDGTDVPPKTNNYDNEVIIRHAVAFCLVRGHWFPGMDALRNKIDNFNKYLGENPQFLSGLQKDFKMWAWLLQKPYTYVRIGKSASEFHADFYTIPPVWDIDNIPASLQKNGVTIFMGKIRSTPLNDKGLLPQKFIGEILEDFDRLACLYVDGIGY